MSPQPAAAHPRYPVEMGKSLNTVASVIVTFITTLILNTSINYFASDRGAVSVSKPIPIDGRTIVVVSLENYSAEFIQGIALELPANVPLSAITSDAPVKLSEPPPPYPSGSRLVTVDQVSPRLLTRLFITWPHAGDAPPPRIANISATGLRIRHENQLESPLRNALISGLIVAAAYALFTVAVGAYASRQIGQLRGELTTMEATVEARKKDAKALDERLQKAETRIAKQRLLLQARLFDYAKELDFWRKTISQLLLAKGADLKTASDLTNAVTNTLRTFGTREPPREFETVRIAATWMANAEREDVLSNSDAVSKPE